MKFTPEFALALECCRWNFPAASRPPAARPVAEIDWGEFERLVAFHRIGGLVWAGIEREAMPEQVRRSLAATARQVAATNLKLAAECASLQHGFAQAGIDLLFFKGISLSALAYRDPFLKMSSDIDILISAQEVGASARLLRELRFRAVTPAARSTEAIVDWHARNKESVWVKEGTGVFVELHSQLADNPRLIPDIGMDSPRQQVAIGNALTLTTLATDELLSYLFVHGAGSAWFRLKWICDVAAMLRGMTAGEIERVYRIACASKAGRAPAQALLLAHQLFGIVLAPALRQELESDPVTRFLTKVARAKLLKVQEPTSTFGGTAVFHLVRPLLLKGWKFAADDLIRQLSGIVRRRILSP